MCLLRFGKKRGRQGKRHVHYPHFLPGPPPHPLPQPTVPSSLSSFSTAGSAWVLLGGEDVGRASTLSSARPAPSSLLRGPQAAPRQAGPMLCGPWKHNPDAGSCLSRNLARSPAASRILEEKQKPQPEVLSFSRQGWNQAIHQEGNEDTEVGN